MFQSARFLFAAKKLEMLLKTLVKANSDVWNFSSRNFFDNRLHFNNSSFK
jgi:hypothetical protein